MSSFKIAISAGHGRYTAGKRCLKSLDPNETREWVLNARIADKVEKLLSSYTGCSVLRVDDRSGGTDVSLRARSNAANSWKADFYLSIHHNAGINGGKGGGIVVFTYTTPLDESVKWQEELYKALIDATGLVGNRYEPLSKANFHECREPYMPAVLLELGFMDSSVDVPIILSEEFADKCAAAIVDVIVRHAELSKSDAALDVDKPAVEAPSKPPIKVDYASTGPDKSKAGVYVVNSHDGVLNLRTGASADKTLIEAMKNGTKVRCYGYYTGAWLYVVSDAGNTGFCHSGYLKKV